MTNELVKDNTEKWDSRELGASDEHVQVANEEEMSAFSSAREGE